jgi:hypothetical protein
VKFSEGALDRHLPEAGDAHEDLVFFGEKDGLPLRAVEARIALAHPKNSVGIEEIAHRLLHVFLHVLDRFAEVIGDPDFSFQVAPASFAAFLRGGLEFGNGFAALGDDEGLAGAGLAEEAGEVGLGFVGADFLDAGRGFHTTSLLNRPVASSCMGEGAAQSAAATRRPRGWLGLPEGEGLWEARGFCL